MLPPALARLLPTVEKPSRYLGTEVNSIHKQDAVAAGTVSVRLALCFPDLYDIGLGNLGLHILYGILNKLEHVWAERVYAPAKDLEAALRREGLPLFALESKDPLDQFDGIGFTLQSELTFTNILNVIDLAGLALRTTDRRETDPLTFAGGPAVFNPEPLAPFMDFFVIGDGEDVVVEIAEVFRTVQGREARLDAFAKVPGIYVPARYPMETLPDGSIRPPVDAPKIAKRTVAALDVASFPVATVVPFTEQVHDHVSLEVLRGCTQGCRFCQAGMTTRPVRERTLPDLGDLLERTLDATGYDDVSLVSLSTCDYSRVKAMVDQSVRIAKPRNVSVSLPSLRLDSFSVELADMVADTRRTGLTFAPEAASPRLRAVINKWIPDEELIQMSSQAYAKGWNHVKLYFMIGLPTERDDDILAIADLTQRTIRAGREHNRGAMVRTGVSTFVPKPFTPFQWAEQIDMYETDRRQRLLGDQFKTMKGVKFGRHHPEETFLEGLVSRADRRAGDLIEAAFKNGARFEAWSEHLDFPAWDRAIQSTGYDVKDALRERSLDERLPWDHIDIHVPKSWFVDDWNRATELKHAQDCRHSKCHRCGVIDVLRPLCAHMLRDNIEGAKEEKVWTRKPMPPQPTQAESAAARQRVRIHVGRTGDARFLSQLELQTAWIRTMRRAKVPVAYSQGFHPLPRLSFSSALAVGEESTAEYLDVVLTVSGSPEDVAARLRGSAPAGFEVYGATEVDLKAPSLMGVIVGADYVIRGAPDVRERIEVVLQSGAIAVSRKSKAAGPDGTGRIEVDVRAMIRSMEQDDDGVIRVSLQDVAGKPGKAKEIVHLLGLEAVRVTKVGVHIAG
ncbi:MAG: TIGR03960 family B12-binding radical SAM protein [Myxococcales bacterium]|nr:TIGR03960 family B12-binding radical SAM protein [Myxococcales bacterium]